MDIISRRSFLSWMNFGLATLYLGLLKQPPFAAAITPPHSSGSSDKKITKRIGIALGAGGAKGLSHILMLEALDELGIKPHRVTGASIGAAIGALYCSGHSGKDIRKIIDKVVFSKEEDWQDALIHRELFKMIDFFDPQLGQGGLIKGDNFLRFFYRTMKIKNFEELAIPLKVVAAIYISPEIDDIRTLEFYRFENILQQARPAKEMLKDALRKRVTI